MSAYITTLDAIVTAGGTTLGVAGLTTQSNPCSGSGGGTLLAFTQGYNTGPTSLNDGGGHGYSLYDQIASSNVSLKAWIADGFTFSGDAFNAVGYGSGDFAAGVWLLDARVSGSPTDVTQAFGSGNVFAMPALGGYAPVLRTSGTPNDCAAMAIYWPDSGDYIAFWAFGFHHGSTVTATFAGIDDDGFSWNHFGSGAGNNQVIWAVPDRVLTSPGSPIFDTIHRAYQADEGTDS